jgi:phage shock protein E
MSTQFVRTRIALLWVLVVMSAGAAAEAPRPTAADLHGAYESGVVFVDVRTDAEWSDGHLKNAVHLPLDEVEARAASLFPAKDAALVLYCRTGRRAESAAEQLRQLGFTHVSAMTGGYDDLKAVGFPVVQ